MALPVVLALLAIGGLLIAPTLNYASTSLNAGQVVKENVRGIYAADAGIEDALWKIKNSTLLQEYQLPENINQMQVDITTEDLGSYTLAYYGKIYGTGGAHPEWLTVTGDIGPLTEGAYPYTITVTGDPESNGNITLAEVGVRLPVGYSYQPGSAAGMSPLEPEPIVQDAANAWMLAWKFDSNPQSPPYTPEPVLLGSDPESWVQTQSFYITGEGQLDGDYTWVISTRQDIGTVGEVSGNLYRITVTATRPESGDVTAKVVAEVIWDVEAADLRVILWQVSPQ